MFTPDPTVNGPWTHTRADIPLFKTMGAISPSPSPLAGGATTKPVPAGGKTQAGMSTNPAFQQWRTALDTWRSQRPARPDFRAMLASVLEKP